ncbi:hypothetical protein ABVT39_002587 [Epinephelus coioides]
MAQTGKTSSAKLSDATSNGSDTTTGGWGPLGQTRPPQMSLPKIIDTPGKGNLGRTPTENKPLAKSQSNITTWRGTGMKPSSFPSSQ